MKILPTKKDKVRPGSIVEFRPSKNLPSAIRLYPNITSLRCHPFFGHSKVMYLEESYLSIVLRVEEYLLPNKTNLCRVEAVQILVMDTPWWIHYFVVDDVLIY